ncbi:OLC1v1011654C1 [Oldenlandia corymbosa var. corymbosa]|uniref:OLC1v1011654C1 n=1 Tax=Oldenlandia corymbosa var. corymbosa TaxID=529605 RepID=A0AAV1DXK8_OLDCO|nr:OLC1v1011654C1 [Oldenlandia corymbosa var. corymbosa]
MCYGGERLPSREDFSFTTPTVPEPPPVNDTVVLIDGIFNRLAETEARLERARAREAELIRRLEEMRRLVSVMEILETYLKRRYGEHQDQLYRLYSQVAAV